MAHLCQPAAPPKTRITARSLDNSLQPVLALSVHDLRAMPRRRSRLQRLKHSVVVTFSAAAAGSAGCDAFAEPGVDEDLGRGAGGIGGSAVAGTAGGPPFTTVNPPFIQCPAELPTEGTPCQPPSVGTGCTFPIVAACGDPQPTARCPMGFWVVELTPTASCNPPFETPVPDPPLVEDAGVDEDAGLDDDAGLDGDG